MLNAVLRRLGRYFLAGVFAVLPLVITVAIVIWMTGFISRLIGPGTPLGNAVKELGFQVAPDTTSAYVIGWVVVLAIVLLLGMAVEIGARHFVERRIEGVLRRIPVLGGVYGTATQLVDMFAKKKDEDLKGMQVVFCVFGKDTGAAFLALQTTPERFTFNGMHYHAVVIPSAPLPVGGSLMFVPADSVRSTDISIDAFMIIYVSMGVSAPEFMPKPPS